MLIHKAYRYELKPNNKQRGLFIKACGVARFAWNWGLAQRKELYATQEDKNSYIHYFGQAVELTKLKKTNFSWMYEVSRSIPREALRDLESAYTNFFRRYKNGEKTKPPKFKKKGKHDRFRLCNDLNSLRVENIGIRLPRIGIVRTKESTCKLKGRILNATVSREADRWFISLCVEQERIAPTPIRGDIVGIDLGLTNFATIWDGKEVQKFDAPKPLAQKMKRLQRTSRQRDRKQIGSNNYKKGNLSLARLHRKIRNTRKDFLAKLTTSLAKTKLVIVIEDLAVENMKRTHRLARSINDVGWGEFRRMLEYKTMWYGSRLIVIGRFEPTSKRCHVCGAINKDLDLSQRTWVCPNCGTLLDRDKNAAINIRRLGLEILNTEGSSGIYACGQSVRPLANPMVAEAVLVEAGSKQTST